MRRRPSLRPQAALLLGLLVATATGLPSHHHAAVDGGAELTDAGHHSHGVQLFETGRRLASPGIGIAVPAPVLTLELPLLVTVRLVGTRLIMAPSSRAPPPSAPRAPPLPA